MCFCASLLGRGLGGAACVCRTPVESTCIVSTGPACNYTIASREAGFRCSYRTHNTMPESFKLGSCGGMICGSSTEGRGGGGGWGGGVQTQVRGGVGGAGWTSQLRATMDRRGCQAGSCSF